MKKFILECVAASNELVFINFYADWCRFSNLLMPIFDEAADKVTQLFPESGKVVMAKVDCDRESSVATRFHITKYPTLKVIRNGQPAKKEYRGQRSVEAFETFIKNQLEDPIKEYNGLAELTTLDTNKRIIIGYFDNKEQAQYNVFRRVASNLKDDCLFYVGFGDASKQMHPPGEPIIVFRPDLKRSNDMDETFEGDINNFDELHIWVAEKCVPLVREITFENAEELTEEGLPFLILFHHPDDTESIKKYNHIVVTELLGEKQNINFLTADGRKFAHPLHHLGKSESDLPLIAIDSFRHMYLFSDIKNMEVPGKVKQFIQDLYSGKLHREFHYGPDESESKSTEPEKKPTNPPESTFKKLAPSKNRYTLIKEEL
ncbi:endoplasmic reticulum resident protein 44 [Holotrichia oblita]|uniref:Endoplasmic reticulum resident protein 44 n=1 Tax=Holotrichia oblita TaxID=644536 RepID=A0ACB9T2J4_HOLOL|nr:endoplasmic reticulum resident protein 44 [Holotrichia oblita]